MSFWKDERLNALYQQEQLERAEKARTAQAASADQAETNPQPRNVWDLFSRLSR